MGRVVLWPGLLLAVAALGAPDSRLADAPKAVVGDKIRQRFIPAPFDRQKIRGPLGERMRVNLESRLLKTDGAALLAAFRSRPASQPAAGEYAGRFLEAASHAWAYSGDERLKTLLDRVAQDLIATQTADGYLGVYADPQRWTGADLWVHRSNLAGLLRYHEVTGDAAALAAARKIGDLLYNTFGTAAGKRDILKSAPGLVATSALGPMAVLYRYTNEARHLEFAHYLVQKLDQPDGPRLLTPLVAGGAMFRAGNGRALEKLANLSGLLEIYRITGEEAMLLRPVVAAWKDIVANRLYLTGTASASEYFRESGDLPGGEAASVGEGCVTAEWLELNRQLLSVTGEPQFAEEIERTLFNSLLGAQDPKTGAFSTFSPLVGRKRPSAAVSCTLSSGAEAIAGIPQFVWGLRDDGPAILLYAPGEATIPVRDGLDVPIKTESRFPADGAATVVLRPGRAVRFPLYLRVPSWCTKFAATVKDQALAGQPGRFLRIERTWGPGDTVQIQMDLPVRIVQGGKSYPDFVAILRGPQALALETSLNPQVQYPHRAAPKSLDPAGLGLMEKNLGPAWPQAYTIEGIASGKPQPLTLVPFADAVGYRVWLVRPDRIPVGPVAVTAFGRESWSRAGTELGSVCDERPDTFRNTFQGRAAALDWYAVEVDQPVEIVRVLYRHGMLFSNGGWFDASQDKPRIQIKRTRTADWETVATLDAYPAATASAAPSLREGEAFSVRLKEPVRAVGLRITGKPGRSFSTCAELAGYDK